MGGLGGEAVTYIRELDQYKNFRWGCNIFLRNSVFSESLSTALAKYEIMGVFVEL